MKEPLEKRTSLSPRLLDTKKPIPETKSHERNTMNTICFVIRKLVRHCRKKINKHNKNILTNAVILQ